MVKNGEFFMIKEMKKRGMSITAIGMSSVVIAKQSEGGYVKEYLKTTIVQ